MGWSRRSVLAAALLAASLVGGPPAARAQGGPYEVGVYYFPGWRKAPEIINRAPWDVIRPYPEREPELGWYEDGTDEVTRRQLGWMQEYGVTFVIYDWYWLNNFGVSLNHAVDAYRRSDARQNLKFSLLWANHSDVPSSMEQYDQIVDYWIANYFSSDDYYKVDGKPAVFIFSPGLLDRDAHKFGSNAKALLARAQARAVAAGLPGIYFVAATQALDQPVKEVLPATGYAALSAYNYHSGLSGTDDKRRMSISYAELADGYAEVWDWMMANATLPYFVPATSGWDKRPWGGSKEPEHDNSVSDPAAFGAHLERARAVLDRHPDKTRRTVVICCWNEFGEGSYIEPTKRYGFAYLEQVRRVFGATQQ